MDTLTSLFKSDEDKALNGIPVPVGYNKNGDEVIFYIAEAGNPNHVKIQRLYSKRLEMSRKNVDLTEKFLCEIIAKSIFISWSGVLDDKGHEIESTFENKFEALMNHSKIYHKVLEICNDPENYRINNDTDDMSIEEALEDTEKN